MKDVPTSPPKGQHLYRDQNSGEVLVGDGPYPMEEILRHCSKRDAFYAVSAGKWDIDTFNLWCNLLLQKHSVPKARDA